MKLLLKQVNHTFKSLKSEKKNIMCEEVKYVE